MYGFIDSASEHAAALSHFHNYAIFFLILVIVFVVWLLKMILKFVILEKNLTHKFMIIADTKFPSIFVLMYLFIGLFQSWVGVSANYYLNKILDIFFFFFITKRVGKAFYNYSTFRTLYPDQGNRVNSFKLLPSLYSDENTMRRVFITGNLVNLCKEHFPRHESVMINAMRQGLHNLPALFPYERVEIESYEPFNDLQEFLSIDIFLAGYVSLLKDAAFLRNFSYWKATDGWGLNILNVKNMFGFSSLKNKFFYKTYSHFVIPYSLFSEFNISGVRMFFYLFFQHVRHRKILEWIWTCVPAFILLFLLYPSLILLYCYDRPYITKPYLTFKAIGHQWYWSYEYSDFVAINNEINDHIKFDSYMIHQDDLELGEFRLLEVDRRVILPIGVCMRLITTSFDVLHSWAVPALGVKIDAVPGRLNQFWIVADRPGTFYGQCSEICGVNHGFMPIAVEGASFIDFFKSIDSASKL